MPKHYENARDCGGNRPYEYDEKRGYKRAFAEDKEIDLYEAWKQAEILQPKLTFQQIVGFLKPLLEAKALGDLPKSETAMEKRFTHVITHPQFNKSPKPSANEGATGAVGATGATGATPTGVTGAVGAVGEVGATAG
ncbi:hypothetical protein Ctob_013974 [Chrysochromulina tobinii]|uniref:Uncharacterized protein n=1 Tax=Chrysochromulina tobinii TaxID=1460289 RepID=A0A0M0K1A3_9EUKA|nr:hypothetical protein Ctob_013974 [Chrysochromulina tobinii]|eukprot:KOO32372.1 hypothetical protein Ctob_013974 [Chrysochromulina sp. CCMP291]